MTANPAAHQPAAAHPARVLFCLDGWSQQEIAVALRLTRGGVAANLAKARHTLKEALAGDRVTGEESLVAGMGTPGAGSLLRRIVSRPIGLSRPSGDVDPLVRKLLDTHAWVRAAVESEPQALDRARAALARRLAGETK